MNVKAEAFQELQPGSGHRQAVFQHAGNGESVGGPLANVDKITIVSTETAIPRG